MRKLCSEIINTFKWGIKFLMGHKNIQYDNSDVSVVLLGNGQSVTSFPFFEYASMKYDFCCVNYFPLSKDLFHELKPRYYCIIDPAFFDGTLSGSLNYKQLIEELNCVNWNMTVITIFGRSLPICNKYIHYEYINTNRFSGEINAFKHCLYRRNLATCDYQNVMVAALYYFVMSSCKKIVLTGVENDWHRELYVDENNDVLREDTHFYGKEVVNITEQGEIKRGELYKYFLYYYTTLYQYHLISDFAKHSSVPVINTCLKSYIDVFEKGDARGVLHDE